MHGGNHLFWKTPVYGAAAPMGGQKQKLGSIRLPLKGSGMFSADDSISYSLFWQETIVQVGLEKTGFNLIIWLPWPSYLQRRTYPSCFRLCDPHLFYS